MQIVSDRGMDLAKEQMDCIEIHQVPLLVHFKGKTYRSGVDIDSNEFYRILDASDEYPTTSQPSAGDFAELYRRLAATDPDILSIHISSGLSGTLNSAKAGSQMVPEANVTFVDTKTLSCPMGWQVEAAARAVMAGWPVDRILDLAHRIGSLTEGMFTIATLKYLVHGGRISHLKGLMASLLRIQPVIGIEKERGTYVNLSQERTLKRAILKLGDLAARWVPNTHKLRVQVLHGNNPEGAELLQNRLRELTDCIFLPTTIIGPVLGAHTGTGLVGLAFAPANEYPEIP